MNSESLTFEPVEHVGISGVLVDNSWAIFWKQNVPFDLISESHQDAEAEWTFIVATKDLSPRKQLQKAFYPDCDFSFSVVETHQNWALALGAMLGKVQMDRITKPFLESLKAGAEKTRTETARADDARGTT